MSRRGLLLVLVVLLVLVGIGTVLYVLRLRTSSAGPQPEQQASEAGRSPPAITPTGPVSNIGSGQVVRGDWYELAFTAPQFPDDRSRHQGGLDERLVTLIDRATSTLDVAGYDFDLANVAEAMARASQRGVRVRMVTDTDTLGNVRDSAIQAAFEKLRQAGIPIVDDQRQELMHHKFTVVDGEWVQTGSWNYTDGDTYRLNNNQLIAHSRELAANYTAEFEKMFVQRRFGPRKPPGVPNPQLTIGGARVESYFSPEDGVAERLIETVRRQATRSLYFLAFSFTHDGLGEAITTRSRDGVAVQGVFETTGSNTTFSEYGKMKQAGLDVYQDGNPWVMHHKVIILDERVVVFGSYNFSQNAERDNDENVLIVEEPTLAQAFKAEYDRVVALAKNPPVRKK